MTDTPNSIKDEVLKSIQEGRVSMKPRWHFVLRAVLLLSGVLLAVLALLYLVSFVIFVLHETGAWFVPSFGLHGLAEFLVSVPWLIVLVAIIFLVILEILVRRYAFAYRKPLLITILGVLAVVLAGGFVLAQTSFHRALFDSAREEHLPFGGGFYLQYGTPHRNNVAIGAITQINDDTGYTIEDRREQSIYVELTDDTDLPDGRNFRVGDSIVVFGNLSQENVIQAIGIRKINDTEPPPMVHMNLYSQ